MRPGGPCHFGLKRVRSFSRKFMEFVAVLLFPGHEFSRIKFSTVSERVKGPHELTPTCNCSRQSGVRRIFVAWPDFTRAGRPCHEGFRSFLADLCFLRDHFEA